MRRFLYAWWSVLRVMFAPSGSQARRSAPISVFLSQDVDLALSCVRSQDRVAFQDAALEAELITHHPIVEPVDRDEMGVWAAAGLLLNRLKQSLVFRLRRLKAGTRRAALRLRPLARG